MNRETTMVMSVTGDKDGSGMAVVMIIIMVMTMMERAVFTQK
jgi:hypothetical protein